MGFYHGDHNYPLLKEMKPILIVCVNEMKPILIVCVNEMKPILEVCVKVAI